MDQQYLALIQQVLDEGTYQFNERTQKGVYTLDGASMRIDLRKGMPVLTTKKFPWKPGVAEWIGFIRGVTSAADFRALGCKFWDANANETQAWLDNPFRLGQDHLGPVYGSQWRRWKAYKGVEIGLDNMSAIDSKLREEGWNLQSCAGDVGGSVDIWYKEIDQVAECIRKLVLNPSDRRILFHGWNPTVLDEVALPACHLLYQFLPNVKTRELSLALYIRSNDLPLGNPVNVVQGALWVHLMARLCGFTPKTLNVFIGDAHIYEDQVDGVREQLTRKPYPLPKLVINDRVPHFADLPHAMLDHGNAADNQYRLNKKIEDIIGWLDMIEPDDFTLEAVRHSSASEDLLPFDLHV